MAECVPMLSGIDSRLPGALPGPSGLRVLHVQNGRNYGGVQRMLTCLAVERAHAAGMEPVFALCYAAKLASELTEAGARLEMLGEARMSRPWSILRAALRLWRLLGRERFDVAVFHGSWPLAVFGWVGRLRRLPVVLWMHNDAIPGRWSIGEWLASRLRPDLVICNSAFTAASLPALFSPPPRHRVLPCPVSLPNHPGDRGRARATLRKELATPESDAVIVLVGRPEAWKGHRSLIEALIHLRELPGWTCWVAGGAFDSVQADFLVELQALAREGGVAERVRFLGQRGDVPELLAGADLFCHPNIRPEPFGIAFIEALYAGLPVVTTELGGAREIVDASCGRFAPPGDAAALAVILRELIAAPELRGRLGAQGLRRAESISGPARLLPRIQEELAAVCA